jgi:hypothetical protein
MPATEAQIRAAQENGSRSKGPVSPQGKSISMRNSFKHGMSGKGLILPESDLEEIERSVEVYLADMRPSSPAGEDLIRRMATSSVQMELTTRHQFAATAMKVRHAADAFDEARFDEADDLYYALAENPRKNLRKLRKSPEGVDRLIEAWTYLRADLTREPEPYWTADHIQRAANMVGLSLDHVRGTRLGAFSRGVIGDFHALTIADGGHLRDEARQVWSRDRLVERIDLEIAALEEHRLTLDLESIEIDRAQAGERALFDTSKEATLARRYAAEAQRSYFKTLNEFRQVEAESLERAEADPAPPPSPESTIPSGSSREPRVPMPPEFVAEARWEPMISESMVEDLPISPARVSKSPE